MKAVLFDLDGTLVDSRADLATAINLTRADFGLSPLPTEQVVRYVGEGMRMLVMRALPERPGAIDTAMQRQRAHYRAHLLDQTALYPGVRQALEQLRSNGWRCGVVTNKSREFVDPLLDGLAVASLFDALVGGGEAEQLKPDPAPLRLAAQRLGVSDLRESWMVGDHYTDLEAGRRAGMKRCFCRFGFGETRGEAYDLAVDSLLELAAALGKGFRE